MKEEVTIIKQDREEDLQIIRDILGINDLKVIIDIALKSYRKKLELEEKI